MKKDSEVIDALAKIAKLKESQPTMGQRRANVKGWKKFKKHVKRRSTINEPVRLIQSPTSSPTSSPVHSRTRVHRSNSLGKNETSKVSHKETTADKSPVTSPVIPPRRKRPSDKRLEDTSVGQPESVGSSTSSSLISAQHSSSIEHEEQHTTVTSPLALPVNNDNSQLSKETNAPCLDNTIDVELVPQTADDMEEKITLQEAINTLEDASYIYDNDFGNQEHQEEMMRLFRMLEGDHLDLGPTDPDILEDLKGWRLAPKDNK